MGSRAFSTTSRRFSSGVRAVTSSLSPLTRSTTTPCWAWYATNSASATPIIAGMDFGHTDPFFVLPYGVTAEIDCDARRFSIIEPAVV